MSLSNISKYQDDQSTVSSNNNTVDNLNIQDDDIEFKLASDIAKVDYGFCFCKRHGQSSYNTVKYPDPSILQSTDKLPYFKSQLRWFYLVWDNPDPSQWFLTYSKAKWRFTYWETSVEDFRDRKVIVDKKCIFLKDFSLLYVEAMPLNGFRIYRDREVFQLTPANGSNSSRSISGKI